MRKSPSTSVILMFLVVSAAYFAGCGGNSSPRDISEDPQLAGSSLGSFSSRYTDTKPSLSADGTRFTFISGRESTDTASLLKAFKATWGSGVEPSALTRVSGDHDIGLERAAHVSPDGKWILIEVASVSGGVELYLQGWDSTDAPVLIPDEAALKSNVSFAPGATTKLLTWISSTADNKGIAKLLPIGAGTEADLAVDNQVEVADDEGPIAELFFVPSDDATYQLVTGKKQAAAVDLYDYEIRRFTEAGDAKAATRTPWLTNVRRDKRVQVAASMSKIVLMERLKGTTAHTAPNVGEADKAKTAVISEPIYADLATTEAVHYAEAALPGTEIFSAAVAADGSTAFLLARNQYSCAPSSTLTYGTALMLAPTDASAPRYLAARLDAPDGAFSLVEDVCDTKKADDSYGRVDDKITELVVNAAATPTIYKMLYVSIFATAFEADCRLRTGDPEVMAIEVNGESKAIYAVSQNKAPIESVARGDQAACAF